MLAGKAQCCWSRVASVMRIERRRPSKLEFFAVDTPCFSAGVSLCQPHILSGVNQRACLPEQRITVTKRDLHVESCSVPSASAPSQASSNTRAVPEGLTGISISKSQIAGMDTLVFQLAPRMESSNDKGHTAMRLCCIAEAECAPASRANVAERPSKPFSGQLHLLPRPAT